MAAEKQKFIFHKMEIPILVWVMLFVYMFMTEMRHWCELLVQCKESNTESDEGDDPADAEEEMPDCVKHIYS